MTTDIEKLHTAIRNGDKNTVKKLLSSGTDLNGVYYGMTPLLVAIVKGSEELATMLIEKGCDVTRTDVQKTLLPVMEAVLRNQVEVVKGIADKQNIDLDMPLPKSHHTPLTYAAEKGYTELAKALIKGGASVSKENGKKEPPLYIAAREGHTEICESLLGAGAQKDALCGDHGHTPLIAAVVYEQLVVAKLLIKADCNVNLADNTGLSPLWYAVSSADVPLAKLLVSSGADVHFQDPEGQMLIQTAKEDEMDDMVDVLLKKK